MKNELIHELKMQANQKNQPFQMLLVEQGLQSLKDAQLNIEKYNKRFANWKALHSAQIQMFGDDEPVDCPRCGRPCTNPADAEWIAEFGECLGCDHLESDNYDYDAE